MNPWVWRIVTVLLAIALIPEIVSGTASLISYGIQAAGEYIHSLFEPLWKPGNAKLEEIIELCLYFISVTLLFRVLFGGRGGE